MANIYNPIPYGPAGQNAQTSVTTRNTQTGGSLSKIVQQPGDTWPSVTSKDTELKEVFKGPAQVIKNLPFRNVVTSVQTFKRIEVGKLRSVCGIGSGAGWVVRFDPPQSLREDGDWVIRSIDVTEAEAGDHATMTIAYGETESDGETDPDHDPETDDDVIKDSVVWTMTNQPQEYSIYAYCTDSMAGRYTADGEPGGDEGDGILRKDIEAWLNEPNADVRASYQWMDYTNGTIGILTEGEKQFAKLLQKGITGIQRHYPVIQCQWNCKSIGNNKPAGSRIGDKLDHYFLTQGAIEAVTPGTIPWVLPEHRVWLLSQDDVSWNKDGDYYTRTMAWIGVEEGGKCTELYGDEGRGTGKRWQFGCGANT